MSAATVLENRWQKNEQQININIVNIAVFLLAVINSHIPRVEELKSHPICDFI